MTAATPASAAPTLLVDKLAFAESPRWHRGALWFSDFFLHTVFRVDQHGVAQAVATVPQQPSGLGWGPDDRLLVVSMLDHRLLRQRADGGLAAVADLGALAGGPCNDMAVDARGGAYIGNFGFDFTAGAPRRDAALVYVPPGGEPRVVATELSFPNGTVITPDGATLIVAETLAPRLTAFRVDAEGSLHDRRVWADLGEATPDGICLDAEGAVWVASPRGHQFLRVREGGRVAQRIACERQAIACALGGPDGRRLFLASGRVQRADAALAELGARIEFIDVDVAAAAAPR